MILPSREWLIQFTNEELEPVVDLTLGILDEALHQGHLDFYDQLCLWFEMVLEVMVSKHN